MKQSLDVSIDSDINVSSSGDYFVRVRVNNKAGLFSITSGCLGTMRLARYKQAAIKACLHSRLQEGTLRFYEYDGNRVKRYDHLRYFDETAFKAMIG